MLYIRREVLVRVGSLMRVLSPRAFPTPRGTHNYKNLHAGKMIISSWEHGNI